MLGRRSRQQVLNFNVVKTDPMDGVKLAASAQALPQSYSLANYEVDGLVYL
jgi:hypothetical protein